MLVLRDDALREIESGKGKLEVKNSLDLGVRIKAPAETTEAVAESLTELADLLGVSQASLETSASEVSVELDDLRELPRCQRSWKRDGTVKERDNGFILSERDAAVTANLNLEA